MDFVERTVLLEDMVDEACQWKIVPNPKSLNRADQWSLKLPAPYGRWMLRICTIGSVTALGELGIHVLSLKQAARAVSEAAVGATVCE